MATNTAATSTKKSSGIVWNLQVEYFKPVDFPLDGTGSSSSAGWSPSQVRNMVDEAGQNLAPPINIIHANVVYNILANCGAEQLRSLFPDRTGRDRSPIDDRRVGNSSRRTQIIENRRHSATRRRSMEDRTCSYRSIPRRLEYNRREHGYSHGNHRGNCRHCEEVPRERNAHSWNSPRSQNSFRLQ